MDICLRNKIIISVLVCIFIAGCATQTPYIKLDSSLQKDVRVFNSIQYVPLTRLCDAYGLAWNWDPYTRTATIEKKGKIILRSGSGRILVNGVEKKLENSVVTSDSALYVPVSFVREDLSQIADLRAVGRAPEVSVVKRVTIKTVVIDPGHGGKDPGAIGRRIGLKERDLTLELSKRLKEILEDNGIKVIMTRGTNTFIPLPNRTDIANDSKADLFVSIHINASKARSMDGFECYYLSEATDDNTRALEAAENESLALGGNASNDRSSAIDKAIWDMTLTENRRESAALASHICAAITDSGAAKNRGVKTARFFVLKGTRMPAVLVEMGYISHPVEEARFTRDDHLDKLTDAVAKGILAYRDEYERTEGFTN